MKDQVINGCIWSLTGVLLLFCTTVTLLGLCAVIEALIRAAGW